MNSIEEDIKTLEEIKDMFIHLKNYGWINDIKKDIDTDKAIQAIEHLIKAYKELKEKLNETLNANLALVQGNANSIPVSLVEETIKELIKEGRHYNANKIEVLQELLEKRK